MCAVNCLLILLYLNKFRIFFVMRHIVIIFIAVLFLNGCTEEKIKIEVAPSKYFPRWVMDDSMHSDQTSGITFIGEKGGSKYFLLADDIGCINRLTITSDTIFKLNKIIFSSEVIAFLDTFPKPDFEEISYDKKENKLFLSIEGDNYGKKKPARKKIDITSFAGIYELEFQNKNIFADTLVSIKKIDIQPHAEFYKHVKSNIGFEGFAFDNKYFYAGLEGFSEQNIFADSTLIYIVDRQTKKIVKEINTKKLGIHTICGLFSPEDKTLLGIDRNNKNLFEIKFNDNLEVSSFGLKEIETTVPNYNAMHYVASMESITMDNNKNVYFIDDPWKSYFVPAQEILKKMDKKTEENFRKFIPIIFKFNFKN